MSEFLAMGGYGSFIWPCFLLTGVVLVWNVLAARRLQAAARIKALRRSDGRGAA